MATTPTCSILIEWENALATADTRPGLVLRELAAQAYATLAEGAWAELLVMYDPTRVDAAKLQDLVESSLRSSGESLRWKLISATNLHYYSMKNLGVENASGEYIIFLDSDVIPDPGWLSRVVEAMRDSKYSVLASSVYVDTDGFMNKVMGLIWVFDPVPLTDKIVRVDRFRSNSVAIRRNLLKKYSFPEIPGRSRGSEFYLAMQMHHDGIHLHQHFGARLAHPRPLGKDTWAKAIAWGRDRELNEMQHGVLYYAVTRLLRAAKRVIIFRHRVSLPAWQVPAALLVTVAFYLLFAAGGIATKIAPKYMARHFLI
jgi:hypothetical protein